MHSNLIFDVGAHKGYDTEYYLHLGFNVVAIEANPNTVKYLNEKFKPEIESERLIIAPFAVSKNRGVIDLYISKSSSGSCSIIEDEVDDCIESIKVKSVPFSDILNKYGVPYYIKIDIQGADKHCLECLNSKELPQFLSWEMDRDQIECLEIVHNLGYNKFKFIDQHAFLEMKNKFSFLQRVKRKIRRHLKIHGTEKINPNMWEFPPCHSSGPFGFETDGKFKNYTSITKQWAAFSKKYPTRHDQPCWFDCHAAL